MLRRICHIAPAFVILACSDDGGTTDKDTSGTTTTTTTAPDTSDSEVTDPNACSTSASGEMTGRWAVEELQTALVTGVPGSGTLTQESTSYYLAEVSGDGTSISFTLCDWLTTDDSALFTTAMGSSVLSHLQPFVRPLSISTAEDGTAGYHVAAGYTTRGLDLENVATDTMPADADDPRVIDEDEDGNPGISLVISGALAGQLYTVHRHHAAQDGCFTSDERIVGLTDWTTDQVILGSNPAVISATKPVASTHPDPKRSHFEAVKVGDTDDCAAIIAKRATLFPD